MEYLGGVLRSRIINWMELRIAEKSVMSQRAGGFVLEGLGKRNQIQGASN